MTLPLTAEDQVAILEANRVLFVGSESARFFALSGYLTFRGFQVDRAESPDDARALLQHLQYRAVVANGTTATAERIAGFLNEVRNVDAGPKTIVLAEGAISGAQEPSDHLTLAGDQPIAQLARALCISIVE